MFKIMYRVKEAIPRHMSAVAYSKEAGKMVEAHFSTQEEAEKKAHEWFDGQCDSYYVKEVESLKNHDKISFTREYCRCRRIPYRVKGEALFIDGWLVCASLLKLDYPAIINMIDSECCYDHLGRFEGLVIPQF